VVGRLIAVLVGLLGVGLWALGFWQVYAANRLLGAALVLAGVLVCIGVLAWWRREPAAGIQGMVDAIVEFIIRA
jgi:ascorbate-specific PTS system EIIC-type component UlaA